MLGYEKYAQLLEKDKVVLFVTGNFGSGGAPKMLTFAANQACRFFDEVHIICFSETRPYYQLDSKVVVHFMTPSASNKLNIGKYLDRVRCIRKVTKRIRPLAVIGLRTAEALYAKLGAPNNVLVVASERGNPKKIGLKYRILAKILYKRCDLLIFQTEGAAEYYGNGVKGKFSIIPNPFCIEGEDPGVYTGKRDKRIVSVSRLSKEKNIQMLIKAYSKSNACGEYTLVIYGDGPERKNLTYLVKKLNIEDNVHFAGEVSSVAKEIHKASLYINASNAEGMPNSQIEAMGLGIPCIATRCMIGNLNPLIIDGVNGLSIPVNDEIALVNAINTMITDEALASRISLEGAKVRELLSVDRIVVLWESFFRKIVSTATRNDRK